MKTNIAMRRLALVAVLNMLAIFVILELIDLWIAALGGPEALVIWKSLN